jgi:pimeloyl-ACP methyl ester carboxylesterase
MHEARYRGAERKLWASVGVSPADYRLHLGRTGADIRVQEVGTGPAVVFLHGASNSGTSWAQLVAKLEGFRCILVDRPGCGLSEPLETRFEDVDRLADFADAFVVDLLDAIGLEDAAVVATSFGGYFAFRAAAAHPGRVRRIVEMGWTVGAPIARAPFVMRLANVPGVGRVLASVPPNERAVRAMLRQVGLRSALDTGRFTDEMLACYVSLLRNTDTMRNELAAGPRIVLPLRGMNERVLFSPSLLASIHTPLYFLWGEDDPQGGADVARHFVAHFPDAVLELVPGAGHAVWIDEPDHAVTTVTVFLRD